MTLSQKTKNKKTEPKVLSLLTELQSNCQECYKEQGAEVPYVQTVTSILVGFLRTTTNLSKKQDIWTTMIKNTVKMHPSNGTVGIVAATYIPYLRLKTN